MDATYTIGRLARVAKVPISTVRYYEQRGLLRPERRTAANYRIYGPASLKRLRFIRAAQQNGFTLEDIVLLLRLRDGAGTDCCGRVAALIEKRLGHITGKLRELRRVEEVLRATVEWCHNPPVKGRCRALDDLESRASAPPR